MILKLPTVHSPDYLLNLLLPPVLLNRKNIQRKLMLRLTEYEHFDKFDKFVLY